MKKTTAGLVIAGLVLLGGFLYLRSRPVPEAPPEMQKGAAEQSTMAADISPTITMSKPADKIKQYDAPPEMQVDKTKHYTARMDTSKGKMIIELFADEAPVTVNNFVFLAKEGFYDQTAFHRIISGFMIQGGDPLGTGTGSPGYTFADEPITKDYKRGIVAMANAGPNTNGSQFFIMHKDNVQLPKDYVIFGQVTGAESLATLDAIASTPVVANDYGEVSLPTERIEIKSVTVEEE